MSSDLVLLTLDEIRQPFTLFANEIESSTWKIKLHLVDALHTSNNNSSNTSNALSSISKSNHVGVKQNNQQVLSNNTLQNTSNSFGESLGKISNQFISIQTSSSSSFETKEDIAKQSNLEVLNNNTLQNGSNTFTQSLGKISSNLESTHSKSKVNGDTLPKWTPIELSPDVAPQPTLDQLHNHKSTSLLQQSPPRTHKRSAILDGNLKIRALLTWPPVLGINNAASFVVDLTNNKLRQAKSAWFFAKDVSNGRVVAEVRISLQKVENASSPVLDAAVRAVSTSDLPPKLSVPALRRHSDRPTLLSPSKSSRRRLKKAKSMRRYASSMEPPTEPPVLVRRVVSVHIPELELDLEKFHSQNSQGKMVYVAFKFRDQPVQRTQLTPVKRGSMQLSGVIEFADQMAPDTSPSMLEIRFFLHESHTNLNREQLKEEEKDSPIETMAPVVYMFGEVDPLGANLEFALRPGDVHLGRVLVAVTRPPNQQYGGHHPLPTTTSSPHRSSSSNFTSSSEHGPFPPTFTLHVTTPTPPAFGTGWVHARVACSVRDQLVRMEDTMILTTSLELAGLGVSMALDGANDLLYASMTKVEMRGVNFKDGRLGAVLGVQSFQVDDQNRGARFPVVLAPTPLSYEDEVDLAPSISLKIALGPLLPGTPRRIELIETYLAESTLKLDQGFLISLQNFMGRVREKKVARSASTRSQRVDSISSSTANFDSPQRGTNRSSLRSPSPPLPPQSQLPSSSTTSAYAAPSTGRSGGGGKENSNGGNLHQQHTSPPLESNKSEIDKPTKPKTIYLVEGADFRPIRLNITFKVTDLEAMSDILRHIPLLAALVGAMASISDAPLRIAAVRIVGESRPLDAVKDALVAHYTAQITRGLFAIAGSVDVLGSPVHLLDSLGHGAFSFFYEPAASFSKGYLHVGAGIQRAGESVVSLVAGAALDSFSKFCAAVAKALTELQSQDPSFQRRIEHLRRELDGGVEEPLTLREGFLQGTQLFARSLMDAVVGFVTGVAEFRPTRPNRLWGALVALLLRPATGVLDALRTFSVGARNAITVAASTTFPLRLPRRETAQSLVVARYSAKRAAGAMLVERKFRGDAHYIAHEHVHLLGEQEQSHNRLGGRRTSISSMDGTDAVLTLPNHVAVLLVTQEWIVAARHSHDKWALPTSLLAQVKHDGDVVTLVTRVPLHEESVCTFQVRCAGEPRAASLTALIARLIAGGSCLRLLRAADVRGDFEALRDPQPRDGTELDVVGRRVTSAVILSHGVDADGVTRYWVRLSADRAEWYVKRRYQEFLNFRNAACAFLQCSRRAIPLPPKRMWSLSRTEVQNRQRALQQMLDRVLAVDLLSETEELRAFLKAGAERVVVW